MELIASHSVSGSVAMAGRLFIRVYRISGSPRTIHITNTFKFLLIMAYWRFCPMPLSSSLVPWAIYTHM